MEENTFQSSLFSSLYMHPILSYISDSQISVFWGYAYSFDTKSQLAQCIRRIWVNKIHLHTYNVSLVYLQMYLIMQLGKKKGENRKIIIINQLTVICTIHVECLLIRPRPAAKMVLDTPSSLFCIPVAGQYYNK